jgi:hypothetical protein
MGFMSFSRGFKIEEGIWRSALDPSWVRTLQGMRMDARRKNKFYDASIRWLDGYSS